MFRSAIGGLDLSRVDALKCIKSCQCSAPGRADAALVRGDKAVIAIAHIPLEDLSIPAHIVSCPFVIHAVLMSGFWRGLLLLLVVVFMRV